MNALRSKLLILISAVTLVLSACSPAALQSAIDTCKNDPTGSVTVADGSVVKCTTVLIVGGGAPAASQTPGSNPTNVPAATGTLVGVNLGNLLPYTPDWTGLTDKCPSDQEVLEAHGLTMDMLEDGKVVTTRQVSWEPCLVNIELDADHRGTEIPLVNGYAYDTAPVDDDVTLLWGGDPQVKHVTLQWGTSFRWGPTYKATHEGWWLDPNNAIEWATRSVRFARYWRNLGLGISDVPYFGRSGPYYVQVGNLDVAGWVAPSIDAVSPRDWRDATAMLGGLARKDEWTTNGTNWAWKYSKKVAGSPDYCPQGDPCWQTVYVPQASTGYVELWVGNGPVKFYATNLATLLDGGHNVDEFSYHPFLGQ